MLLTSLKENDTAFVAKAIQEHQLKNLPKAGFHSEPDYWQETNRWRRVIERYEWGVVMFISDRERRSHATIVAKGQVDLVQGRVSQQGTWVEIKPDWYREMALELSQTRRQNVLEIPSCLGFHEPDVICDGGKNEGGRMEPPCAWRERCMALQTFCQNNNRLAENMLKGKPPEMIVQMTTRLLAQANGIPSTHKPKAAAPAAKPAVVSAPKAPAVARATKAPDPAQTKAMYDFVASVTHEVASAADLQVSADLAKSGAAENNLYLVDRTSNSDYISVYIASKPKPRAIASFRVRARVGFLVQFPIPNTSALLSPIVPSDVRQWKDGAFQSAVADVPMTGDRLEHIKSIMVAIILGQDAS
jgi:hypothetical protein